MGPTRYMLQNKLLEWQAKKNTRTIEWVVGARPAEVGEPRRVITSPHKLSGKLFETIADARHFMRSTQIDVTIIPV